MARAVWRFAQVEWLVDRATVSPDARRCCPARAGAAWRRNQPPNRVRLRSAVLPGIARSEEAVYKDDILKLIQQSPLDIDLEAQVTGNPPTSATSDFLTNKEQGDWAERVVHRAINECADDFLAVRYGRSDDLSAGDAGFADFYAKYQNELNTIGKRPDVLIFRTTDFPNGEPDTLSDRDVSRAIAALEIRSSSFLIKKYEIFADRREKAALAECRSIRRRILDSSLGDLLARKNPKIYDLLSTATDETFRELSFRRPSWSSTPELQTLTELLKELKTHISTLHKRDYLSITPKQEDIALVNRRIQKFNVKHFYLQVFFDKAYVISFRRILELVADDENDGVMFSIEKDVKNQRKTTVKVNVAASSELLGRIDMPQHYSAKKELDRGRLLFYVSFEGGKGYLDPAVFREEVINA